MGEDSPLIWLNHCDFLVFCVDSYNSYINYSSLIFMCLSISIGISLFGLCFWIDIHVFELIFCRYRGSLPTTLLRFQNFIVIHIKRLKKYQKTNMHAFKYIQSYKTQSHTKDKMMIRINPHLQRHIPARVEKEFQLQPMIRMDSVWQLMYLLKVEL